MDVGSTYLQDAYHSRRSLQKGRISINGALAKAARTVKPGDVIQVRKPPSPIPSKYCKPSKSVSAQSLLPK